ncbi:hypothetical protein [Vibrio rumoiensis]|uniref:hypothetical protein n=1 Tax=Vibrio rumoiensis TaxID=76258 RepID=UPI003AA945DD
MSDQHEIKTIETLLSLAEVIPRPPALPMTYQELANAVERNNRSTSYHAVRRILNDDRVMQLLGIEKIKRDKSHCIRYKASFLEKFSHSELIAHLIKTYLSNLLPKEVRHRLNDHLHNYRERFNALDEDMPDKRWLNKVTIDFIALGDWLSMPFEQHLEAILSALYREHQILLVYASLSISDLLIEEQIMPTKLDITQDDAVLFYFSRETERGAQRVPKSVSINQIKAVNPIYQ